MSKPLDPNDGDQVVMLAAAALPFMLEKSKINNEFDITDIMQKALLAAMEALKFEHPLTNPDADKPEAPRFQAYFEQLKEDDVTDQ